MAPNSAGEVIFVKIIIFESVNNYFMACTPVHVRSGGVSQLLAYCTT